MWAIFSTNANNTYSYAPTMVGEPSRDKTALDIKCGSMKRTSDGDPRSGMMYDVLPVKPVLVWVVDK